MSRSRVLFASLIAVAATATSADAATLGIQDGTSAQLPDVQVDVPQLSPSLPKVQVRTPDVQVPQVRVPSSPTGSDGPVQRLGGSLPGGGGAAGSSYSGSGVSGPGAGGYSGGAGSAGGGSPQGDAGSASAASSRGASSPRLTPRQRRIRAARERRALRRGVRRLRGCLGVVSSFERRVLIMRSGISGPARSRSAVARPLGTSPRRVHDGERSGLRGLREAARSTGCAGGSALSFGGSAASFGDSRSEQMAIATVAVVTGGAPALRTVTTMAGGPDADAAQLDTVSAGQVLGARTATPPARPARAPCLRPRSAPLGHRVRGRDAGSGTHGAARSSGRPCSSGGHARPARHAVPARHRLVDPAPASSARAARANAPRTGSGAGGRSAGGRDDGARCDRGARCGETAAPRRAAARATPRAGVRARRSATSRGAWAPAPGRSRGFGTRLACRGQPALAAPSRAPAPLTLPLASPP